MLNIQSASDLHNKFPGTEKSDASFAPPFTDDPSSPFTTDIEAALDYADRMAEETEVRYTGEEVFGRLRKRIQEMIDEQQKAV